NRGPRSPLTGNSYGVADLSGFLEDRSTASDAIRNILDRGSVPAGYRSSAGNRILLPDGDVADGEIDALLLARTMEINEVSWLDIYESHVIGVDAVDALTRNRVEEFLSIRQRDIQDYVDSFLKRMCEWDFEDTPPLSDLVIDDEDDEGGDELFF